MQQFVASRRFVSPRGIIANVKNLKKYFIALLINQSATTSPDLEGQRFLWLIRMRFVAILTQIPLTFVGVSYGYINLQAQFLFLSIFALMLFYNSYLYRNVFQNKHLILPRNYLGKQISIDLVLFTFFLLLSGSANNPLYSLYYIIAILGGILTSGGGSLFFLVLVFCILLIQVQPLFFAPYDWENIFNFQTLPYLGVQIVIPTITYLIGRSFGELLNRSQSKLMQMTVRSERLDRLRALGALSAGFSHEFASPLHAAKLRLQRARRLNSGNQTDLDESLESLNECESVLKRMNFSVMEVSDNELEIINLKEILLETFNRWSEGFPSITLEINLSESQIKCHRLNLIQSIINVLDNAAEAMHFNGIITIKLIHLNNQIALSVSDEGPGFSSKILNNLGEPFNTNKEEGIGLGLYSTLLQIQSMAGELVVENNTNSRGATVKLLLPKVIPK